MSDSLRGHESTEIRSGRAPIDSEKPRFPEPSPPSPKAAEATRSLRYAVIIPCLNEAQQIGNCVHSALNSGANEVWVVDGGSRDATPTLAAEAGAVVVTSQPGRGRQQNVGASHATCDVLVFLHADCRLPSDAMNQIDTCLRQAPQVVGGAFRQQIPTSGWKYRCLEVGNALRVRAFRLPYGDQAIFVRRRAFTAIKGFPDEPLMEDVILARRLQRLGRLMLLPGPITVSPRRWKQSGVIRQTLRNWCLLTGFLLGVSPARLARHYSRHDAKTT